MIKTGRRLRLFIIARILVVLLLLVSIFILKIQDKEAIDDIAFRGIVQLMAFSCLFSVCSLFALRRESWLLPLTYLQIIWDLLFVTLLLLFTEGIESHFSFLYLLAVMNAGMLLSRREAIYTAALSFIFYGAVVDFQYFGLLSEIGLAPIAAMQRGPAVVFYTIFLHLTGFVLTAFVTGYLAERARSSEYALRLTEVNYDELTRLHTTIVKQLEYGLITVSTDGKIRVFNPYVESLANVSQNAAYGKTLASIFPALPGGAELFGQYRQGEFSYRAANGIAVVIGYATIPFNDSAGKLSGAIITLRNITDIRRMEIALKRADHLAALGELSARIAHEIRNPLAAISGSVQLLSENGALKESDTRLLKIVLRESERLNVLITDFLQYARPQPPVFERIDLSFFIQEILDFVSADVRFRRVKVETDLLSGVSVMADYSQLRQALMNLLINAVDSIPSEGHILITTAFDFPTEHDSQNGRSIIVSVADNGTGLDSETKMHLFEPFWTTKPKGTGLGLATVYRIMEVHGGSVKIFDRSGGGTVVALLLPYQEGF